MEKLIKQSYRTLTSKEITEDKIGERVKVAGWVSTIRDHGGITFVDLRDHYGMMQLLMPDEFVHKISKEDVISVEGVIIERSLDTVNEKINTGTVEIKVQELEILSECEHTLPFEIMESMHVNEEVRLKYRYLDLRNPEMHKKIIFRSQVVSAIRKYMTELGFLEITTPILTSSSPEGARDYIVPSRLHPGQFYALPQAPQQFKQLLMASGFDRYFQIAPCFRDEDARADRSPGEFYQLDMEMSFATQEDVFAVIEDIIPKIFKEYGKYTVSQEKFIRIPYKEALEKYGTDKPDLRNPIIIKNLTEMFKNTSFGAFKGLEVRAISIDVKDLSKSFYERLTEDMMKEGAKGLAWLKVLQDGELFGPIVKFLSEDEKKAIISLTEASEGSSIFFIADTFKVATRLSGALRTEIAKRLDLIKKGEYKFCWITDFPMFEFNDDTQKIEFSHNPFSMPQGGLKALETLAPLDILAYQYDLVLNGVELSSGAVRNHDIDVMVKAFEIAGYTEEDVKSKFAALYNAFQYGVPPHAGIAPGIERILMLLLDEDSIREVVAFPMNRKAQDLLMGAPNTVTRRQLKDVHIEIRS
ncbi:MAG: aspartate--tRNA ligase [Spirochaetales bacterium]